MSRKLAFISVALMLAACTRFSTIAPQKVTLLDAYSVISPIAWTGISGGHAVTWTDDGAQLQAITFFEPIIRGQGIFKAGSGGSPEKLPRFDPDMTPIEIAELMVASYAQIGRANVGASNLRPAKFGGMRGFRFKMTFTSKSGVDYNGFVVGTVRNERLYLIIYTGTRVHYFDKHKNDAEKVIRSIEFAS